MQWNMKRDLGCDAGDANIICQTCWRSHLLTDQLKAGAINPTTSQTHGSDLYHPQLSQSPEPLLTWLAYRGSARDRTYHVVHPLYDHWLKAAMTDNRQTARYPRSVCSVCVCCVSLSLSLQSSEKSAVLPQSTKQCEATAPSCLHFRGTGHVKTAHGSALSNSCLQVEHSHRSSGVTEWLRPWSFTDLCSVRAVFWEPGDNSVKVCIHSNIWIRPNMLLCFVK